MTSEIERLFTAKEERRKELAALPYADKVRIVIQLQRMAAPILRRRGRDVTVWSLPIGSWNSCVAPNVIKSSRRHCS